MCYRLVISGKKWGKGVILVPKKYWCRECNQEMYSEEELITAGGRFIDGEPYCPKRHKIDVYGEKQLAEEFAMMLSVPGCSTTLRLDR